MAAAGAFAVTSLPGPVPDALKGQAPPLSEPYKYHLYISHADEDRVEVAKLEDQLEMIGFKILRLQGGQTHFTDEIDKCRKLIIFITEHYLKDDLQRYQTVNFQHNQSYKGHRLLIPIIHNYDDAKVPAFMKEVNYIKTSEDKFWDRLVNAWTEEDVPLSANIETENIADGFAWGYYYGYLALILPKIQERLAKYKYPDPTLPYFDRFIILMPESGSCAKNIAQVDKNFKFVEYAKFNVTRSANNKRDYGNTIWKMTNPKTGKDVYVPLEYATPLWTMFEMEMGRIAGLSPAAKAKELTQFRKKLREILEHQQSVTCHGKYVLVDWINDLDQNDPHALSCLVGQIIEDNPGCLVAQTTNATDAP